MKRIKVVMCQTGKKAQALTIDGSLEGMQSVVGGWIEEIMPFEDEVALICNEEGKLNGLPLNRGIFGEDGELLDIIAGDFFVAYAPYDSEEFLSLPEDLEEKYLMKFKYPEKFIRTLAGIVCIPANC